MKSQPLGVGLIGMGYAGTLHMPAVLSLPEARLLAVAEVDRRRFVDAAAHGVKATFMDYRELLEFPGIDVVGILTPPASHLEITLAAMEAGKHVVLEKPITATLEDAVLLLEKSGRYNVKICVAYNLRVLRSVRELRQLLQEGRLGEVEILHCLASTPQMLTPEGPEHRRDRTLGGGSVIELGVHHYDLWSHLLGSHVAEVSGVSRNISMHDQSSVICGRMTSGALVNTCISLCAAEQYEVEVLGSKARAGGSLYRYDGLEMVETHHLAGSPGVRAAGILRAISHLPAAFRARKHGGTFLESYRELWRHMLNAVSQDLIPEPGLADGVESLAVAVAASTASRDGKTTRVQEVWGRRDG
jgi:predicted dehydrogenase